MAPDEDVVQLDTAHHDTAAAAAVAPVPVRHHGPLPVTEQAADHGAYYGITFTGTESAQPVVPYDKGRARAYVYIVSGTVILGSRAQTQASPALGFTLTSGMPPLIIGHKAHVYVVPNGSAAQISVAIERWD